MRASRLDYLSGGGGAGRKPRASRTGSSTQPKPRRPETPPPASNGVPGPESRRIDIGEIIRTVGMRYTHVFAVVPDPELDGADLRVDVPTSGDFTLTNTGAALILRGKASGSLRLSCARCLEEFVQPVAFALEEEFDLVGDGDAPQPEELRAVDANDTAPVVEGTVLDVGELLRQSLILEAPLQPLCREDCPGVAGGDAGGAEPDTHRPLAALAALLHQDESGEG